LRASAERCPECGNAIKQALGGFLTVRWRLSLAVILGFGLIWLLGIPAAQEWRRHQFLAAQEDCCSYTAPADQIVFDCAPFSQRSSIEQKKLLDLFHPDYSDENYYEQFGIYRPAPECWAIWFGAWRYDYDQVGCISHRDGNHLERFDDRIAPLFLHERKTPSGSRRIVAVRHPYVDELSEGGPGDHMIWSIFYYTFTPAVRWIDPKPDRGGRIGLRLNQENGHDGGWFNLRFFAGQADPQDATHFTLPYDVNGIAGTIDCHLTDSATDPIECHFRPGSPGDPSTQPSEKPQ